MRNYLLPGLLVLALLPAAADAQAIVAENFNGAWTTPATLTTAGTAGTWGDDGATGDQQWHRNDYPTGWTPSVYSPVRATDADGVAGTYAAFHAAGAASGSTGSLVSPLLSFAAYPDHKVLSSYLSNDDGADVVRVYLSTDGGLTYGSARHVPRPGQCVWQGLSAGDARPGYDDFEQRENQADRHGRRGDVGHRGG